MPVRLLLDENLPERLRLSFGAPIEAVTVRYQGWSGRGNGDLLQAAEHAGFDVFLTVDRGVPHEQNLGKLRLGIVLLETGSNRLSVLAPGVSKIQAAIRKVKPGQVLRVQL